MFGTCSIPLISLYILHVMQYGILFRSEFTVMSKADPTNAAFTSAALGLHTDLAFYKYAPGVSIIHLSVSFIHIKGRLFKITGGWGSLKNVICLMTINSPSFHYHRKSTSPFGCTKTIPHIPSQLVYLICKIVL